MRPALSLLALLSLSAMGCSSASSATSDAPQTANPARTPAAPRRATSSTKPSANPSAKPSAPPALDPIPPLPEPEPASTYPPIPPGSPPSPPGGRTRGLESTIFADELKRLGPIKADQLAAQLGPRAPQRPPLDFDPASARYYAEITSALAMTPAEIQTFRQLGFVALSRKPNPSMGWVYQSIYVRDLPVFITTDSILEALHKSFDQALEDLERESFAPSIKEVLRGMHGSLAVEARRAPAGLLRAMRDVDLYLTVARNLLEGAGTAQDTGGVEMKWSGSLSIEPVLGVKAEAIAALNAVGALNRTNIELAGRPREVDFSQFRPRGHYDNRADLRRYFRTMMWLGRADIGFHLLATGGALHHEGVAAAVLSLLLHTSGQRERLAAVANIIDFLVGGDDSAGPAAMLSILAEAKINSPAQLADPTARAAVAKLIASRGAGRQQIKSEVGPAAAAFQMFGQRFVLDSFILGKVVFDQIPNPPAGQPRTMPKGLDVMAALGSREAAALLDADLREYGYSANLLAARKVVDSYTPADWSESAYAAWLDALRALNNPPQGSFPRAMQSRAWQHKQLQAQLGAWAELRHDTILYAKQSYTQTTCEYPAGYVEPYPEFYARIRALTSAIARRIQAAPVPPGPESGNLAQMHQQVSNFFGAFAATMQRLEDLAKKELSSQPFTAEEQLFLKTTINAVSGGSGPPTYQGWYGKLFYGKANSEIEHFEPTIADVHTDPNTSKVLEVGVGSTNLLVIAIDNEKDRAVYVGPVYTYYEFTSATRMTDMEWHYLLRGSTPPSPPEWVRPFTSSTTLPLAPVGPVPRVNKR